MASQTSSTFTFSFFVIVAQILFSSSSKVSYVSSVNETYYHRMKLSTHLKPSICHPLTKGQSKRGSSLELVDQHGPCYQPGKDKDKPPTMTQVLSRDQSRVNSIHSLLNSNKMNASLRDSKTTLPANVDAGLSHGTSNYIVNVGLGTPKMSIPLAFDTGSDLTWTQCQPCLASCYKQKDPIFDPASSKTYKNVACESTRCLLLAGSSFINAGCGGGSCFYNVYYHDNSFSNGFLALDTLTLTDTDVFKKFQFGCGQNNAGRSGDAAGVLGLGRQSASVITQTASKYGKYFSYCLPTPSGSRGHLTFGKEGNAFRSLKSTPFAVNSKDSTFYFVNINAIEVAGKKLPISRSVFNTAGTIIDSGTVFTRLPPTAYSVLRKAFRKEMSKYPRTSRFSILDTCYDLSDYTYVNMPKISFYFSGNIEVPIALSGTVYGDSASQICLAFAGNDNPLDAGIFGSMQQRTLELAYDVEGGYLGIGTKGCT